MAHRAQLIASAFRLGLHFGLLYILDGIENTQIPAPICLGTGLNVYSYNSPLDFKMRS